MASKSQNGEQSVLTDEVQSLESEDGSEKQESQTRTFYRKNTRGPKKYKKSQGQKTRPRTRMGILTNLENL